jgi:hypothetical protein
MSEYQYILEPYKGIKTRYNCPGCQQRDKTFSLYIDRETGEPIHHNVGRCNRESNCGYHYTPKQYFQDNNFSFDTPRPNPYAKHILATPNQRPVSFIPVEVFKGSLRRYEKNNFVKFLTRLFGFEIASELISSYFIGTSNHWNGATVFWQIDTKGNVRTGKIMLYSSDTGKRVKDLGLPVYWIHKALKLTDYELKQCLFGEHLLIDKTKPVAVVESEKTAIIASVYLPQFIWLAVGSLTNLNAERCVPLKGRSVALFPDLNGYDKWTEKAKELAHLATFTVSNLLERGASQAEREQGLDIADYLIRFDYKSFALPAPIGQPAAVKPLVEVKRLEPVDSSCDFSKLEIPKPQNWDQNITELEFFFKEIIYPTQPVKLGDGCTITNIPIFIESHLATVKANNGNHTFLSYLNRLKQLKAQISTQFGYPHPLTIVF